MQYIVVRTKVDGETSWVIVGAKPLESLEEAQAMRDAKRESHPPPAFEYETFALIPR